MGVKLGVALGIGVSVGEAVIVGVAVSVGWGDGSGVAEGSGKRVLVETSRGVSRVGVMDGSTLENVLLKGRVQATILRSKTKITEIRFIFQQHWQVDPILLHKSAAVISP
jgi:hypothetical protein